MEKWTSSDFLPNCTAFGTRILIWNHWTLLSLSVLINYFCTYKQQNTLDYFYTNGIKLEERTNTKIYTDRWKIPFVTYCEYNFHSKQWSAFNCFSKYYRNNGILSLWLKLYDRDHILSPTEVAIACVLHTFPEMLMSLFTLSCSKVPD